MNNQDKSPWPYAAYIPAGGQIIHTDVNADYAGAEDNAEKCRGGKGGCRERSGGLQFAVEWPGKASPGTWCVCERERERERERESAPWGWGRSSVTKSKLTEEPPGNYTGPSHVLFTQVSRC